MNKTLNENEYIVKITMADDDYVYTQKFTCRKNALEFAQGHYGCIVKIYKNGELIKEHIGRKRRKNRGD